MHETEQIIMCAAAVELVVVLTSVVFFAMMITVMIARVTLHAVSNARDK